MNEEIIKICIYFLETKKKVKFLENKGKYTSCIYKDEKYKWYYTSPYKLSHDYEFKSIDFFQEINKIKTFKEAYSNKCRDDLENVLELDDKELYDYEVNTQNLERYPEIVNKFIETKDIFQIQSPMATRKTNIIYEIIEQCNEKNLKILMISNRRTLAKESYLKYKKYGFKYYEHQEYDINNHLIVQFDSLYKYNIEFFDVIIIDEITSLLLYMSDPYLGKENKFRRNIETFMNLDTFNKKIVLLDAFIIHNPFKGNKISLLNTFREDINVVEYLNKHTFISKITRTALSETISVSCNEKRILHKICNNLNKRGLKCLVLTGDTENKDKIFEDLQKVKDIKEYGYDALLYSPVVTTGVSFLFKIDNHFHYDNSRSIDPVNSIQMLRRIRNAKKIHYFILGKVSYKTTDINKIEKYDDSVSLFQMVNVMGMFLGLTNAGKRLSEIIKIKNIFMNTHKYAFRELMKYQFKSVHFNTFEMDPFKF
jgi:hypothetical protein